MPDSLDPDRLRTLIDVGGFIVSELDRETVLEHVLDAACRLTGARYAALGVIARDGGGLERFVTRGVDERTARAIGEPPQGRGVLGVLIGEPAPLRLANVGRHPASYGFPTGHPPMDTFLGVPVFVRGQVWGNLYLAEKHEGEFDQADEDAAVVLARWAGIAIENARLHGTAEERRTELERAVRELEATQAIVLAVGGDTNLERVLELIAKRGRALVEARTIAILLRAGDDLELAALAGHGRRRDGEPIPAAARTPGRVALSGESARADDARAGLRIAASAVGVDDPRRRSSRR
jgi:GAF domain-containing protein